LICVFDHADHADQFLAGPWLTAYQQRAKQCQASLLAITSCKGAWDGRAFDVTPDDKLGHYAFEPHNPAMAAITRASIRPAKAVAFWRYAPAAQADLSQAPGCSVAMGLGEAPLVRQCTFSVWRDTQAMLDYAHTGAHQQAITAAYKNDFFSESMFVRMRLLRTVGEWVMPQEVVAHG
jgi:spheroidene monooxygenase